MFIKFNIRSDSFTEGNVRCKTESRYFVIGWLTSRALIFKLFEDETTFFISYFISRTSI